MPINPSKSGSALNNPTQRANELNDPQFAEQQGYFPYDLTHGEYITPRFGEVTPSLNLHTVPGDRIVCRDNTKLVLNQVNGNLLSTVNHYVDTFFVPYRSMYPTNYAKLIPNPTKGDDLPNAALPQFPLSWFVQSYLRGEHSVNLSGFIDGTFTYRSFTNREIMTFWPNSQGWNDARVIVHVNRVLFLATMFSRGQLLDYLGYQLDGFDNLTIERLQPYIERVFETFQDFWGDVGNQGFMIDVDPASNEVVTNPDVDYYDVSELAKLRDFISTAFERGKYFWFTDIPNGDYLDLSAAFDAFDDLLLNIFSDFASSNSLDVLNADTDPFRTGFVNMFTTLAYQQCIAQYYTNNTVDNIFNSDLFMELLRSVLYPSFGGFSSEPTFTYNGVTTEYDYITTGGVFSSLIVGFENDRSAVSNRQFVFATIMFLLRRSLRYGDYFSTARPNMLAVGQLQINVEGNSISPIDVTKNLLMQRYLNAANYIGSGELPYFASIYGVTPSDTGTYPRFVSHRKIQLQNDVVTNTADNQGYQSTNLVGYSDEQGFDIFLDDFGVILSLQSFDVLPVYESGIESTFHFSDRFDIFNPMLQNIGDQPIFRSEIIGEPSLRLDTFGYTMRNAELKYKLSRSHGGFATSLSGFLLRFPLEVFIENDGTLVINPDFIRDRPYYFDQLLPQQSGFSPSTYFHFVVACLNQVQAARRIQATPPVLF